VIPRATYAPWVSKKIEGAVRSLGLTRPLDLWVEIIPLGEEPQHANDG
jgi:hypothetical protein